MVKSWLRSTTTCAGRSRGSGVCACVCACGQDGQAHAARMVGVMGNQRPRLSMRGPTENANQWQHHMSDDANGLYPSVALQGIKTAGWHPLGPAVWQELARVHRRQRGRLRAGAHGTQARGEGTYLVEGHALRLVARDGPRQLERHLRRGMRAALGGVVCVRACVDGGACVCVCVFENMVRMPGRGRGARGPLAPWRHHAHARTYALLLHVTGGEAGTYPPPLPPAVRIKLMRLGLNNDA